MKFFFLLVVFLSQPLFAYELVAHRGVHQTYDLDDQTMETCTAEKIDPPRHAFLENTLPSIRKAFEYGATMVEVDVHPTSENDPDGTRLIVFHDWTLNCRTNATCLNGCKCSPDRACVTDQQPWAYLKTLDVGHGYTSDNGKTFPFRGKAVGMMPTFKDTVQILLEFPDKKLLVNVKDKHDRTQKLLLKELADFPVAIRSRVLVEMWNEYAAEFQKIDVPVAIYQSKYIKECLKTYVPFGWTGYFSDRCKNIKFFIPRHQDLGIFSKFLNGRDLPNWLYGWPNGFIERMRENGSEVYLSSVESLDDLKFAQSHSFFGIMTNRIEFIGPLMNSKTQSPQF